MRKSVDETWAHLEARGRRMPRDPEGRPLVPASMPSYDDDHPRCSFFRTRVHGDWSGLSLPRTYFGRSLIERASFADTDLSESRMCWNDFDDCDFTGADLSGCDMRASIFRGCKFAAAVLRRADLRRSRFDRCDFAGVDLSGAVAEDTRSPARLGEVLSGEQLAAVSWVEDAGPEPPGG
jgi:BTB/POZ domain-containing protein KCTD9